MKVPEKDIENAFAIMKPLGYDTARDYLDLLLDEWGMEFAGATKEEATFIGKDGNKVILMPGDRWRLVDADGKSFESNGWQKLKYWYA